MAMDAVRIFEYFKEHKPKMEINGRTYWLVEGDLLMDEDRLFAYAIKRVAMATGELADAGEGLIAKANADGKVVRWRLGKELTYFVRRNTFAGEAEYQAVVNNMRSATANWESACNVKFKHLADLDNNPSAGADAAVFDVAYWPVNVDGYIATAFFPDDPVEMRHVFVYPIYFSPQRYYDPVGVFRHELGHVLGFRHEHISADAALDCRGEPPELTVALTEYDSKSVMHYPCGEGGSQGMFISDADRIGAQRVYGLPASDVDFKD